MQKCRFSWQSKDSEPFSQLAIGLIPVFFEGEFISHAATYQTAIISIRLPILTIEKLWKHNSTRERTPMEIAVNKQYSRHTMIKFPSVVDFWYGINNMIKVLISKEAVLRIPFKLLDSKLDAAHSLNILTHEEALHWKLIFIYPRTGLLSLLCVLAKLNILAISLSIWSSAYHCQLCAYDEDN